MDEKTKRAFEWAKKQQFTSVAADYARTLAVELGRVNTENDHLRTELEAVKRDMVLGKICETCSHEQEDEGNEHCALCYEVGYRINWKWRGAPNNSPSQDVENGTKGYENK